MPYPTLPGRRFEYDIGGGSVYYGNDINDITTILSPELMNRLNSENNSATVLYGDTGNTMTVKTVWVFLPEKYVVAGLGMVHSLTRYSTPDGAVTVAGSPDSTMVCQHFFVHILVEPLTPSLLKIESGNMAIPLLHSRYG